MPRHTSNDKAGMLMGDAFGLTTQLISHSHTWAHTQRGVSSYHAGPGGIVGASCEAINADMSRDADGSVFSLCSSGPPMQEVFCYFHTEESSQDPSPEKPDINEVISYLNMAPAAPTPKASSPVHPPDLLELLKRYGAASAEHTST